MSIEVANESGVEVDELGLVALGRHVLDSLGIHPLAELSILLVDEPEMSRLHERWMNEPGPTDVLAFPMDELSPGRVDTDGRASEPDSPPAMLGDVALCPAVAARQAVTAGHSTADELNVLCTHGILHLLGYDHAEPAEHKEMFGLQARLLGTYLAAKAQRSGGEGEPA